MSGDRLSLSRSTSAATAPIPGIPTARTSLFAPSASSGPLRSSLGKRPAGDAGLDDPASTRRQLSSLKSQMTTMERHNHTLKAREKEQASQIEAQRVEIERLKAERRVLHEGEMHERGVGEVREQEFYAERRELTTEIANLRRRNTTLTDELENLRSAHNILSGQHSSLSQNANGEISLLTSRLKEVEKERDGLRSWERRAKGLSIELEEEKRKAEEKVQRKEDAVEGKRVDEVLHKEVKRQSLNLSTIYRENETLKAEVVEMRQKKKEVDAVERAAKDVERALNNEIRVLQEQLERARRDMDSLTHTFPSATSSPSSDETLRTRLATLSDMHNQATNDLIARDATIRELRERLANLAESSRSSVGVLTKRAEEAERELRWAKEGRASAERREELAREEAERIRAASSHGASGSVGVGLGDQSAKVAELESLVALYRSELEKMSRDSREMEDRVAQGLGLVKSSELQSAQERGSQLEHDISSLEGTLAELTTANTRLDAEVNDLMRRVASGEYNPATERCLELRANPAAKIMAVRKQELDDLRAENDELLERMRELDELLAQAHSGQEVQMSNKSAEEQGMVPRSSFDRLRKDNEETEKAHAKRLLRLKEIFGTKSKEFLEAVYSLLGWRIKFDESGADIRLTSMYAPKGKMGLTLKFASQEGHFGTMQMSGALARGLEESRHFWIVERQSVPGFLAQVTTEMFEKTTIGRAAGYVGLE